MAYKCLLNKFDSHTLKDGFTITRQLNEDLDSALVSFKILGENVNVEPFDEIEIFDTNNKITRKKFLVDSPEEEIFSYGNSFDQSDKVYTLPLFSETKILERRTLPNCSVTQPIQEGMTYKTVWDEIKRFCNQYLNKIRIYDAQNNYKFVNELVFDPALETRFSAILCPEFQWNRPTLREVLNDLMSTDDCIALVRNNVLTFYDLKARGNQIDMSHINYSKRTQSSADYCSDLNMAISNGVGKSKTIVCEKKTFTTEEAEMTTNNMAIMTQHPIYNIISCKINYFYKQDASYPLRNTARYSENNYDYRDANLTTYHEQVDVTKFVVEKDIYDLAINGSYPDYSLSEPYVHPSRLDQQEILKHKQYLVYYTRGGYKIEGWGIMAKDGSSSSHQTSHVGQMVEALNMGGKAMYYGSNFGFYGNQQRDIREITVDLVYETMTEKAMVVGKYLPTKHAGNVIFDNQTSSYVDIMHQSIFEYAKANRLGNKIREIHGVYTNEADIPELGDLIGNEVLFMEEITYYDNQFEFKGFLTENYILRNYFTGIQAKRRSWQYAKDEDAFTRQDVFKNYLEFSFYQKIENADEDNTIDIMKFADCLTSFNSGTAIKFGLIQTYTKPYDDPNLPFITYAGNYPELDEAYQLDITAEVQGYSLTFELSTRDNIVVDYYIYKDGDHYMSDFYKYCDEYGEFAALRVILASYVNPADNEFEWSTDEPLDESKYLEFNENATTWWLKTHNSNSIENKMSAKSKVKPLIKVGFPISSDVVTVHGQRFIENYLKDNREIIKTTLQYEYCSDTEDIIVTPEFIKRCSCYNDSANDPSDIVVYMSTTETYNLTDTTPKGTINSNLAPDVDIYNGSLMISCVGLSPSMNPTSWCFADGNGNILLAVNTKKRYHANLFLNVLFTRDPNIYANAIDRYVVGTLEQSTLGSLGLNYNALLTLNYNALVSAGKITSSVDLPSSTYNITQLLDIKPKSSH